VATFFFLKVGAALLAKGKPDVHIFWVIFFLAGFAIYWTFFLLKKKTSLLVDPGR
jgi:hypothetical protein